MEKINEIKLPEGVNRIAVKQHDDKIVIEFIPEEPKYKDGDFVINKRGDILIFKKKDENKIYDHAFFNNVLGLSIAQMSPSYSPIRRHATEAEKQKLLDALEKEGKRWNAEKKCIEDIPKRKFKDGDKVVLKSGYKKSDGLKYLAVFDCFVGKPLTIKGYADTGCVYFYDCPFFFDEDWLEPYDEELKNGDLAIFWDGTTDHALIRIYDRYECYWHHDSSGSRWNNAIKFESKEQFEKVLRGEI